MKRRYRPARANVHALIERVEQVAGRSAHQQAAAGILRNALAKGAQKAVGPIAEEEFFLRVGLGQTIQHLTRIDTDAGKVSSQAVGRVESDRHSTAIVAWRAP